MHPNSAPGLVASPLGLTLDGVALAPLARRLGTPLYVYSAATLRTRFAAVEATLTEVGRPFAIRFAMKCNRFGPVLDLVRGLGHHIDACSPREVERALQHGFEPEQISLTAGMLSNRDLAAAARLGVRPNLDTFSALRRWAATPDHGPTVGLRINPEVAVGWGPQLAYGNAKFGFDQAAVLEAAACAQALGLEVVEVHMHLGWGLQRASEPGMRQAFGQLAALAAQIPTVRTVNVGGGLCWPYRPEDDPLPVATWGTILRETLADLPPEVGIACEPGTYFAAGAGALVVEVNTVEPRSGATWVGVDAGHAVNVFAAHYGIPMFIQPVLEPERPLAGPVHIAGNINEANDVFARDRPFPVVQEGELLALWPAGAYGASMASDHCLRGRPTEVLVG